VHDVGSKYDPLEAGMVLTCEPGLYIREEKIGIRIEDDILVTDADPVNLTEQIPVTVAEIEALMNSEYRTSLPAGRQGTRNPPSSSGLRRTSKE
jgi:Xaa-Pro aminopeptidase